MYSQSTYDAMKGAIWIENTGAWVNIGLDWDKETWYLTWRSRLLDKIIEREGRRVDKGPPRQVTRD